MTPRCLVAAAAFLIIGSSGATAKIACLVEGRVMSQAMKDCTETSLPIPATEYKKQCEENAKALNSTDGSIKASVLPACPAGAQAACHGLFGTQASAYYYARDAQMLASTKTSCTAQRGQWADNP